MSAATGRDQPDGAVLIRVTPAGRGSSVSIAVSRSRSRASARLRVVRTVTSLTPSRSAT